MFYNMFGSECVNNDSIPAYIMNGTINSMSPSVV
jgi:hypothetical protein